MHQDKGRLLGPSGPSSCAFSSREKPPHQIWFRIKGYHRISFPRNYSIWAMLCLGRLPLSGITRIPSFAHFMAAGSSPDRRAAAQVDFIRHGTGDQLQVSGGVYQKNIGTLFFSSSFSRLYVQSLSRSPRNICLICRSACLLCRAEISWDEWIRTELGVFQPGSIYIMDTVHRSPAISESLRYHGQDTPSTSCMLSNSHRCSRTPNRFY